jgi:FkbM family methyltransferase
MLKNVLFDARRLFYNLNGPWYRRGLAEMFGSRRYSHPALFGMDRRLTELMPSRNGVFVEAGAHDGYTQSNTYFLERYLGWSGVLVEPVPELREKCEKRRPRSRVVGCALVGPGHPPQATINFGDLMSTLGDANYAEGGLAVTGRAAYAATVPAKTLSSVLDEAGVETPDVIVLDLEGHELDALRGLDLDRHAPRFLLIETMDRAKMQPQFDALLGSHFEFAEPVSDFDLLYRRRTSV